MGFGHRDPKVGLVGGPLGDLQVVAADLEGVRREAGDLLHGDEASGGVLGDHLGVGLREDVEEQGFERRTGRDIDRQHAR